MSLISSWLYALGAVLGCSDDVPDASAGPDGGPNTTMALCCHLPEQYPAEVCVGDSCFPKCQLDLDAGPDCKPGHACILDKSSSQYYCASGCTDSLCGNRSECRSENTECWTPTDCGYSVPCLQSNSFCDAENDKCYPLNGDCSTNNDCPSLKEKVSAVAQISCQSFCRLDLRSTPTAWLTGALSESIVVSTPKIGTVLAVDANPLFEWQDTNTAVLVRVLDAFPTDWPSFEEAVVWGASVSRGTTKVAWSSGNRVRSGTWLSGVPSLPAGGVYYWIVLAVSGVSLDRASPLVPFAIGDSFAWPEPGDGCQLQGIPGDCTNPTVPTACIGGTCRRLCASNEDCSGSDQRCGQPIDFTTLARTCEL